MVCDLMDLQIAILAQTHAGAYPKGAVIGDDTDFSIQIALDVYEERVREATDANNPIYFAVKTETMGRSACSSN